MNQLSKLLNKLGNAKRNQSSKTMSKNRLGTRLRFERLEERALMAIVSAWSAENTAADSVGANHGTLINGATFAPGKIGQAFTIDGVNDRINLADSPSLKLTQSLTIEGWIKVNSFPTGQNHGQIFFRGDDRGGLDPYSLATESGGYLRFLINDASNTALIQAPIAQGEFIHVAATLDDATGAMKLYENGTLVAQTTTTVRPFGDLDPASNPGIGIGNHGGYPATPHNFPFSGLIDELKVYDQALTASEVLSIYNATPSGTPSLSISDVVTVEGDIHFGPYLGDFISNAGSGGLNRSTGMTFGPDGNLYVGSRNTNEVLRYNGTTGAFMGTFIANGSGGLSAPAVDGLHFRPDGKLYILSRDTSSVLRFDASTGAFLNVFIPSGSGGLSIPNGMVFGPDGNLYISSANQVLRFSGTSGAFLGVFVASNSGGLVGARSLAFGPDGNLYVASVTNNSVLRYNGTTGAFLNAVVPSGNGGLNFPGSLLFQNGSLYVASQDSNQVMRYEFTTGQFLDAIDIANSGNLDRPVGLLLDTTGNLLVGSFYKIGRYGTVQGTSIKVSLSSPRPQAISVNYATVNGSALSGSDYTIATGTLTFSPGDIVKSIFVPTLDDSIYEGSETFNVILSSPIGATLADSLAIATILDNEIPPTKFYVVNDGPDRTYEYGASGVTIENYSMQTTNTTPRGAASNAAGDKVWVVDANKNVYVYNTSGGLLGSWTAGTLANNATVEGITTSGTDIWIVDSKSDKVFRYAGAASRLSGTQTAASSFTLNAANSSPTDLVTDGSSIWVLNNTQNSDKVFKYNVSGSLVGSWTINSGGGSPTGITLDPSNASQSLWIVDNNSDRVYEYANARSLGSGSQSASVSFALATGNTNPQGIADPPAPSNSLASQSLQVATNSPAPDFENPRRDEMTDRNQFAIQVEAVFASWHEDILFGKSQKRLTARR